MMQLSAPGSRAGTPGDDGGGGGGLHDGGVELGQNGPRQPELPLLMKEQQPLLDRFHEEHCVQDPLQVPGDGSAQKASGGHGRWTCTSPSETGEGAAFLQKWTIIST